MNEETQNPGIEPELEARIVALVLGEASDFEREELNRQIEQRPELAAFMLQMQRVHGLLQDVGVGEFAAPDEDWKLPADRRNAVLAVIRGEATVQPADDLRRRAGDVNPLIDDEDSAEIRGLTSPARRSLIADDGFSADVAKNISPRRWLRNLINVLAVVCVAVATMFYSFSSQERAASEYFYSAAKTDEPRDDVFGFQVEPGNAGADVEEPLWEESTRSSIVRSTRSSTWKSNVVPLAAQLLPQSASGNVDYKKSSEDALAALQDALGRDRTLPSPDYLTDDIEYVPAGPESKLRDAVAQHGATTLEKEGRSTATFDVAAASSPPAADLSVVIAENSTAVTSGELGYDARDGLADSKPAAPDKGAVAFPDSVDIWEDLSDSAPAGTVRLRVNAPEGDSPFLGTINTPSPSESAPISGGRKMTTPRIIIENKEEVIGETSLELAMSDLPSELPDLQQKQGQPQSPNRNEPVADLAKDQAGSGAAENQIDGERLGNEAKPIDSLSFTDTQDDSPMADKYLNGLLSEADDGLGTYAQDNSGFGRARFGRDFGTIGSDRPGVASSNLGLGMPQDVNGDADRIPEGIANFDPKLEKRSQAEASDRGSVARTKSAEDAAGTRSLESLQEAIPQPGDKQSGGKGFVDGRADGEPSDLTSQLMDLNGEDPKSGKSGEADHVTEEFEQKENRGGVLNTDDVLLDRVGANYDFNVKNRIEAPTDTPAIQARRFTIPGTHAGGDNGIPDSRELESTVPPAPVTGKAAAKLKSEEMPIIDGFNSSGKVIMNWEKDENLQERRESGVKGSTHSFFRQGATARPAVDHDHELKKPTAKRVAPSAGLNETTAAAEAFSTFSLHVSDVSFKLAAAALARGEWPEAAKIRIEEFVNAFDYGDPMPCKGERVACAVEQSIHPFVQQRNLLRVSMRTAAEGRASNTPLRLTFLLDNSGSMERTDRQETVRRAFALLSQQLSPIDQVTLISFARQPRLLAEKVSGAESGQLVKLIVELPSEGGTNIEAALQLAFEKATEQRTPGAQNRIILLTDGAVNLGDADPESLSRMVTTMRDAGIAFDAAGISAEGLNDEVLEALTRKGDGRYYLLDSFEDADESFARQIAGALRPSASNVKVQIEFNPKRVGHYRLLGFEKHILKQEDFRNDAVDAAEMAAAEAGVALYQFEAKPDGEGDVGSVSVRFRDLSTGQMVENRWPIPYEADASRPELAAPSLRIATSAALLAAKLRGEPLGETVDLQTLSNLISGLPSQDQNNTRVQQLKLMIEQARQMSQK